MQPGDEIELGEYTWIVDMVGTTYVALCRKDNEKIHRTCLLKDLC